jgi:predicted dehydrogenase
MPNLSRRHFLLGAAAAGLSTGLLRAADKKQPASERFRLACVGVAGQAGSDIKQLVAGGAEIVALCDVHESRKEVGEQRERFPKAPFFTDFRKMIDAGGFDGVLVGTPDHTHAIATLTALRAGYDVYCEKPLTHTVEEARLVAQTAARTKRVTQMGTQIHGSDNYRRVVELIQSGAIGDVKEVHVMCSKSWGGEGKRGEAQPVPKGLNFDLWLGPAAERPYSSAYVPFNWRRWWDFGGGTLNDMACHYIDLPFWALKLRHPTRVEAVGPKATVETAPKHLVVHYDFPARDKLPALRLSWYDGLELKDGQRPSLLADHKLMWNGKPVTWDNGSLFIGSKGMLLADYGRHVLLPENDFKDFKYPEKSIPASIGHYKEWIEACKNRGETTCNFNYASALTETVLLGTVAHRAGKPFDWNAKEMKPSEDAAERFIRKEYRKGWGIGA